MLLTIAKEGEKRLIERWEFKRQKSEEGKAG